MIQKTECYVAVCDVCKKNVDDGAKMIAHYDTEAEALEYALERDEYGGLDCQMIDGKLCCANCWWYGDDDEPAIREK